MMLLVALEFNQRFYNKIASDAITVFSDSRQSRSSGSSAAASSVHPGNASTTIQSSNS